MNPQPPATPTPGPPSWMADRTPVIPDHELVRRIGGGSYGDVWLARTTVGTWRAVKVVFRDRFTDTRPYEREFSGMLKFEPLSRSNEAFVDILQIGRNDADGYFYYVMELADDAVMGRRDQSSVISNQSGEPEASRPLTTDHRSLNTDPCSLNTGLAPAAYVPKTLSKVLLQRGRLPVTECLELGLTLNLGLAQLHRTGLIHRDIKPSNIIFVAGVPKLADIGLVIEMTEAHSFVGTEGFIPPEGPNSPQADLYSLGKVLYEAGMGKDRKDFPEPFTQIAETPDSRQLLEFNAILLKACAANRTERYRSAEDMNADLALLQSGGSVRQQRRAARHLRLVQRAGTLVTALAAVVALGWWWQAKQTRIVRELATDKSNLAELNRGQLVRLRIANGIRQLDEDDAAAALISLGEALSLSTNPPADAATQRVRLRQVLARQPRLLRVFPHPENVLDAEFSPDGQSIVTGCEDGAVRLWDISRDTAPALEFQLRRPIRQVHYTRNGKQLLVMQLDATGQPERVTLHDAVTGRTNLGPIPTLTLAALSPDDRWLAVAQADNEVQIMAADTGAVVGVAKGHTERIESIHFSPDSSQLLTASRDSTVRRWSAPAGQSLGLPLRHTQPISRAIFNRDADRIASATFTGDDDGPIQFQTWDVARGTTLGNPIRGLGRNSLLAFDRSGKLLVTEDREALVRVWNADSHIATLPPLPAAGGGRTVDFSPDGSLVAIGSEAGNVRLYALETGLPVFSKLHHSGRIERVQFNGDGSRLLTASADGTVKLWDLTIEPENRSSQFLSLERPKAAMSPSGRELLLGTANVPTSLRLLDLADLGRDSNAMPGISNYVRGGMVTFDRSGNQWASALDPKAYLYAKPTLMNAPSVVGLWRREGGRIRHFALSHPAAVPEAFFHQDGHQLLTAGMDGLTRVWNTRDGSLLTASPRPKTDTAWIAVSPDLSTAVALVGSGTSRRMAIRDVRNGKTRGRSPEENPESIAAAFSPDGTRIATLDSKRSGRIWDSRSGEPLTPEFKHERPPLHIEWSPDGRQVLTAGLSPEVKVWDATTGQLALPPLTMKSLPVERAHFSSDGRLIVARSDEKLVRVWDAVTGEAVTPLLSHPDHVTEVFVTAAQHLVTIQNNGTVRVWDLTATPLTAEWLTEYGQLLTGSPRDRSLRALGPTELTTLLHSLQARQPDLFEVSRGRLDDWHRRYSQHPRSLAETEAALFHLHRLAPQEPQEASLAIQIQRLHSKTIPPRDPGTPARLLDLTRAYTHSLDLIPQRQFDELPRGRHLFDGIEFDLRGMIQLDHRAERANQVGPFNPGAVVPVGQRCRSLHFLQATEGNPRIEGSTVARWIIYYADGSSRDWPVIYGAHVRDWCWWKSEEPLEANQASVVWRGRFPAWNLDGTEGVRLFKSTWANPKPEIEITRLEYRIGETALKPIVVAITAE